MTAASAIFILDQKGQILIWRDYRGDVSANKAERFWTLLMDAEDTTMKPIFQDDGITYSYVRNRDLYLLAVTKDNANCTMALLFLYKVVQVLMAYFQELEEESIRDNFVIIYELLDEMMDFGYPQATDAQILQEFITQEFYKLEKEPRPAPALSTAVPWRSEGIKYPTNEIFLDVIESVSALIARNGNMLQYEATGQILVDCRLGGMPTLKLGLNDKVQLQQAGARAVEHSIDLADVNFHQCVRLSSYEKDRSISFIPPDGQFQLLSYRLNKSFKKPLFWVEAVVEKHSHSRVEYLVKARSQFRTECTANNVIIMIPVPEDADTPKFRTNKGKVEYAPSQNAMLWIIPQFAGGREFLMRAHFGLPSTVSGETAASDKRPIRLKFEIPSFTLSGVQVRYLRIVERSGYKALPWVKYLTRSGDYQFRLS